MSTIPVMVQNRKHLKLFKDAGAIGRANAITLDEIGISENIVIKRLINLNALEKDGNLYFVTDKFATTRRFKNV